MPKTLAINGACGRMGQAIAKLALEDKDLKLFSAIEAHRNPNIGRDYGEVLGIGKINIEIVPKLAARVDVLIDFSTPPATIMRLAECVDKETALVIGTTGFSEGQLDEIKKATRTIACIIASNMSLGMNILFKRVPELAKILGDDYDIEIIETHHRSKKDAPSGTAKTLAEN
ncbi:4-hydroxy-tetrahydrodipicolinate reductase, partial [Candidatus Peregrinibacteria bacterium]|nr:4-hydroxy-tetrahydrodipicolinate reductase [Candidatus Peregrinibacteria bacterium]